jgi:hypothetical protein
MIRVDTFHEACRTLFVEYPLASSAGSGGSRSMVLLLEQDGDPEFFVLSEHGRPASPAYSLRQWPVGAEVKIGADRREAVPPALVDAVIRGVPLPRDGSLFGWASGDAISALVVVYAEDTPESPEPSWAVMPRAGYPQEHWPPFTGERLFGPWFWDHHRVGRISSLVDLLTEAHGTVFWADTKTALGSDCCVVVQDLQGPDGHTLPRGIYVYSGALLAALPLPSPEELLASAHTVDLASRF